MIPRARRDASGRLSLTVLGAHTHLHSTLCMACPYETAGCCTSPPPYDWADVARVLSLGGLSHFESALARGHLRPTPDGFTIRRKKRKDRPNEAKTARCVFHGVEGCTIDARVRPATCNYYVCDAGLGGPPDQNPRGEEPYMVYAVLRELWSRWNVDIAQRVSEAFPDPDVRATLGRPRQGQPAEANRGSSEPPMFVRFLVATFERLERAWGLGSARPSSLEGAPSGTDNPAE